MSFEYLRIGWPSAASLLSLMSFFDRQGIPEELITSRYGENNSAVNFDDDIEILRNYSLVAVGIQSDLLEMHRLVQFATRKWLEERKELEKWKETYITILAETFPSAKYENWVKCHVLFPHAQLLLEYPPTNEGFLQQ